MPERIGKYDILAEIGQGGFGKVYRAVDSSMRRPVAVKVLSATDDKALLARFRNEATATGNLHHENIVTIYEFGEQDGVPFIAMEFLGGDDLRQIILQRRPLSTFEKVRLMTQVAAGLNCAHRNGVIHRDVKPANIMVLHDGAVKIMDFGIARLMESTTRLTRHGQVVGTVKYMSPEQLWGTEAGPPSDIFAYGVVFYELLAGQHPFVAPDATGVMRKILSEEARPVRELLPECPPALDAIVRRAMEKDQEARYRALEDLLFDLRPVFEELRRRQAAELVDRAREFYANGNLAAAQEGLRQALAHDAGNDAALRLRDSIQHDLQRSRASESSARPVRAGTEEETPGADTAAQRQQAVRAAVAECRELLQRNSLLAATEGLFRCRQQLGDDPLFAELQGAVDAEWRAVQQALTLSAEQESAGELQAALESIQAAEARYPDVPEFRISRERLKSKIESGRRTRPAKSAAGETAPFPFGSATRIVEQQAGPGQPAVPTWPSTAATGGVGQQLAAIQPAAPALVSVDEQMRRSLRPLWLTLALAVVAVAAGAGVLVLGHRTAPVEPAAVKFSKPASPAPEPPPAADLVPAADAAGPPAAQPAAQQEAQPEAQPAAQVEPPPEAKSVVKSPARKRAGDDAEEDEPSGERKPPPIDPAAAAVAIAWTGELEPGDELTLRSDTVSEGQITNGGVLPFKPGIITVGPSEARLVEAPSRDNGFSAVIRNRSDRILDRITIIWRPARR